jgi:hypothetical protein
VRSSPHIARRHPAQAAIFMETMMGNNALQGWAVLVLLLAFTCLSVSLFYGGNIVFLLLAILTMGASISMFLKAKPLERQG